MGHRHQDFLRDLLPVEMLGPISDFWNQHLWTRNLESAL